MEGIIFNWYLIIFTNGTKLHGNSFASFIKKRNFCYKQLKNVIFAVNNLKTLFLLYTTK